MADETIDIRYILNSDEVSSDSKKIDAAISGTQNAVELTTEDMRENIAIQKQVLKELEKQYKELEKIIKKSAPGAVRSELEGQLSGIKSDIAAEKQALVELTAAQKQYDASTRSLRTQIMELRNSMATMTEGSQEYIDAMIRLGQLQDKMGDIQQQGRVFADDEKNFRAATESIQGLSGVMSTGVGIATLFGASQDNLAKIQAKLQAVMAISIGVQQVAQILNKDSYFTLVVLAGAKNMVTSATSKMAVALGISNVAAKRLMATLTLGLSVAIGAVIWAINKMSTANEEARKKQEEAREEIKKYNETIAESVSKPLMAYSKLQNEWSKLTSQQQKLKFVKDNKKAFEELGIAVNSVADAENVMVKNSTAVITALMARAKATAAQQLATEKYKKVIEIELDSEFNDNGASYAKEQLEKEMPGNSGAGDKKYQKRFDELLKSYKAQEIAKAKAEADSIVQLSQQYGQDAINALNEAGIREYKSNSDQAANTLSKDTRERQWAVEQARIDVMNEGSTKQLAQIDLNHKKETAKLQEQKASLLKVAQASGDTKSTTKINADFEILTTAVDNKAMKERATVSKTMLSQMLNDMEQYVNEQIKLGNLEYDSQLEYLAKFGTIEEQKFAITQQFNEKILSAKTEHQKKILEQERDQALNETDVKGLQKTEPFKVLFDNLDNFGAVKISSALSRARELLNNAAADGKFTAEQLKVMYDAIAKGETEVKERNPFVALIDACKDWDNTDTRKSLSNVASSASESFSLIGDCAGIVVGGLKEIGAAGDEETQKILDNSLKLVGGLADIAGGLASMNPAQMLQGAMAVFTSLWELCDARSRNARREIERLQGQIDDLEKSYEVLGDKIEDAYSTDASKMIDQQNEVLENQNKLIEQQKEAEKSKKDPDDGALDEYDKKIEENNKKLEENKEKAVDVIFGADVKSAIDNFANAYVDAFNAGEDRAQAQKDVVKKMIQGMVTEIIKSNIKDKVAALRTSLKDAIMDGVIDQNEQAAIDRMQDEIYAQSDKDAKSYEKWLKGDDDKNQQVENSNSLTGQIKGSVATEASVAELGGLFRSQTDSLLRIDSKLDLGFGQISELARSNAAIEANTLATATNTAQTVTTLANGFTAMHAELTAINKNTSKDTGSYGG